MKSIPNEILERAVGGVGLRPGRFRDQLDERRTLLVFLRHFG